MAEDRTSADQQKNETETEGREQRRDMAEESPNPHNEANVIEMPISTDQSRPTGGQNVAQTPTTRDGRVDPSVGESVGGGVADSDSMFNEADPQSGINQRTGARDQSGTNKTKKPA